MALPQIANGLCLVTTVYLRCTSILFTRHHPIGYLYLNRILTSFLLYVVAAAVSVLGAQRKRKPSRQNVVLVLLFGLVDPGRHLVSLCTLLLNILSLACVLDFVYRGQYLHQSHDLFFSRMGYVDDRSARIIIRAPDQAVVQMIVSLPVEGSQSSEQVQTMSVTTDFTATYVFDNLLPETEYIYATNATHTGQFKTLSSSPKKWSLVTSSCIKPFYPYNPFDHGLRIKGLEYLSNYLTTHPADMMMFLGDFIYIDLPIPHGWTQQAYDTAYRQVYASPSWTPTLKSLPWIHLYDDHEIANDWSANTTGLYQSAIHNTFRNYQGLANPAPSPLTPHHHLTAADPPPTYYTFHRGPVAFFVLDTRRYRTPAHLSQATMLGPAQLAALLSWLATTDGTSWKVVVSSVPFTRNWRGPDAADSWAGYLEEREVVLQAMRRTETGVVILSGDRHEHATTLFPGGRDEGDGDGDGDGEGKGLEGGKERKGASRVIEFSTSPLNQFFEPFSRHHREEDETDVNVFNYPWGSSKFGVVGFEVLDRDGDGDGDDGYEELKVDYTLVAMGKEVWHSEWIFERRVPL